MADATGLRRRVQRWGTAVLTDAAAGTARHAATHPQTPVGTVPHPGPKLNQSFEASGTVTGHTRLHTQIRNTAPQSWWTDKGRGPVTATRAKALRFTIGGATLFRRSVKAAPAQNWWRPVIVESYRRALREAAGRVRL